jgi:hypothetical protein
VGIRQLAKTQSRYDTKTVKRLYPFRFGETIMTDEQLLNSLQGTMATIDPYSVKKEAIDEYRIDTIEERLTRIEDKVDLLISQLKIEFYKKNDGTSR